MTTVMATTVIREADLAIPDRDALRAVMLDGSGLTAIGSELLILAAWGFVSFALVLKFFHWQ